MNIVEYIQHPEKLNKETLYDLRSMVAMYPYYQTARILMLRNLYLLHDPTFDEELRRAAVYITDRRVIFNLVEAGHYKLKKTVSEAPTENRTVSLIDNFLSSIPKEEEEQADSAAPKKDKKPKPTVADATVDYVAYLMATDFEEEESPDMIGQNLIDDFISKDSGRITLKAEPEYVPQLEEEQSNDKKEVSEDYFTETLAGIYIKQGRYLKALEIIKRLNLDYPKKNAYFADQIRFLEKLIVNQRGQKSN